MDENSKRAKSARSAKRSLKKSTFSLRYGTASQQDAISCSRVKAMKTLLLARNQRDSTNVEIITRGRTDVVWAVMFEDFLSDGAHETVQYALENHNNTEPIECVLLTKEALDAIIATEEVG